MRAVTVKHNVISVILPTVRPHLLAQCIESLKPAADDVAYEVIVVADFTPLPDIEFDIWVCKERRGTVDAVLTGLEMAKGDFIFTMNDESTLSVGALAMLYETALLFPAALLTPKHSPAFKFVYYGIPFAPFPFAHRRLLVALGGLFDTAYKCFYADPDLSLRAYKQDVPVITVDEAVITHRNDLNALGHRENMDQYLLADRQTFRKRWDHLGEFCDP